MLKQLKLKNIVLVDEANIPFEPGFNVISGETGAGKSALMAALQQIQGARGDPLLIRHGFDTGKIEAIFNIDSLAHIHDKLEKAGIEHERGDELLIQRELSKKGKNRLFINNQQVHLSTLRKITGSLFEIVGQHASQQLFDLNHHLKIVDLFGGLHKLREKFTAAFEKESVKRNVLTQLRKTEQGRLREIEICRMELEELDNAALKEGEEEELFAHYSRLANTETLTQLSQTIASSLEDKIVSTLHSLNQSSKELFSLDPTLEEPHTHLQSLTIELEELARTFRNYHSGIEHDPLQAETINQRLTLINLMKKKYGPTVKEALHYRDKREKTLHTLLNADHEIETLEQEIKQLEKESKTLASVLTAERKHTADLLTKAMTSELQSLNMPNAAFFVDIRVQNMSRIGQDKIEFFFAPNKGEKKVPIRECASGGEISRLLLSIQTLLAGKEKVPCLVFDEIDANIGGHTAAIVGHKLQQIGKNHQLLCITHFPQVADAASHHVQISKNEKGERTITEIKVLNQKTRESELLRMTGH